MDEQQQATLTLRRLTTSEVDQFRILRFRALKEHPRVYLQSYEEESLRQRAFHAAMIEHNFVMGAFANDTLIGYTILTYPQQGKMRHKGSVWGAYVLPAFRNMDLAKRMRLRLFDIAKSLGLKTCSSAIVASNPAALAVHLGVGYVEMFREKDGIRHRDGSYDDLIHLISTSMLPILSHQNHFKFGYNGEWFRLRQSAEDVFSINYGRCTSDPGDFATASKRAARMIGEAADGPIHVLFSGGVDSEVTMLSFLAAKVPITAAIMRFKDDLNMHDIGFAIRFCQRHDVPYRLYDLDVMQFFEEHILDFTIPTRCVAPMLAATMWLIDQIDGYPVMGQGECYLLRPEHFRPHRLPQARVSSWQDITFTSNQWAVQESELVNSWYRHFLLRGRNGVPGFHQYTPEQILSYLRDPGVVQMMTTPHWNSGPWKLWVYQQHFPLAERSAYTGYEVIMNKIAKYRTGHSSRFPAAHSFVLFDYDTLVGSLNPH